MIYAMGVTSRMKQWHPAAVVREVKVTIDDIKKQWRIQGGCCYWSGMVMNPSYNSIAYHPWAVSIDRLQSERDYERGNIVFALRMFNLGRGKFDPHQFAVCMEEMKRGYNPDYVPQVREIISPEPSLFD